MRKLQLITAMAMLMMTAGIAQQKEITGTVIRQSTKELLSGVTVQARNNTVATDSVGHFLINAAVGETLTFSYVGMETASLKVTASTNNLSVSLDENINNLNQVVVVGYGTQKKARELLRASLLTLLFEVVF